MSEQNIGLIRGLYEAFGRGDVPSVLAGFADDIEWNEAEGMPYDSQRGPQAVAEGIFARVVEDVDGFTVTPEEYFADGDEVVVIARYTGTGHESGKELNMPAVHAWTVRDGKVARHRQFTDSASFNAVVAAEATV